MKKVTAILMLFLFLITNSGIAVTIHSCGGKIASVTLVSSNDHRCACGKKVMKPGCCKSKTTTLKAQKDLAKTNQLIFKSAVPDFDINLVSFCEFIPSTLYTNYSSAFYRPPPNNSKVPIYLLDGIFLI